MNKHSEAYAVVMADDDSEDVELTRRAFRRMGMQVEIEHVENGKALVENLRARRNRPCEDRRSPVVVLLDLNMPVMDGREALMEIKRDAALNKVPVVVLTSSRASEDIERTYSLGANSYIAKPDTFSELMEVVKLLKNYWLGLVELPSF